MLAPMIVFTANEQTYLDSQILGRLATIAPDGAPQVRPVAFVYNHEYNTIDIGGHNLVEQPRTDTMTKARSANGTRRTGQQA